MKLDCLLIQVPKRNNYYKLFGNHMYVMFMPMGLLAIADNVYQKGYKVQILHSGIEEIENPSFSLKDYLEKTKPQIVGLSLHWHYQSYDVIETAKKIRLINPNIFIVLGGFTASFFHQEIMEQFDCIDGVIRGDGELPFLKLTETIINGKYDFYNIPNLTRRDKDRIIVNEMGYVAESSEMDRLSFTNFKLLKNYELYIKYAKYGWRWVRGLSKKINLLSLDKRIVFPLCVTRGCHVNCSFCGGSKISQEIMCKRSGISFRAVEKVVQSIEEAKRYGYDTFFIECFPAEGRNFSYFERLFNEIKEKKIEIDCIADCSALPSKNFIQIFSETFTNSSKSQICISPDSGSEKIRKLNKGHYFSNEELIETVSYIINLKIPIEIFFALGLPFDTIDTTKVTKDFQGFLRKRFGDFITIRTECLNLDPASPMYVEPEKYKIVKIWNSFMDFYYAHGNIKNPLISSVAGYYLQNFFKEKKSIRLTKAEISQIWSEKILCKSFCRLAADLSAKLKRKNIKIPIRIISIFSNLICNCMKTFWKLQIVLYRISMN